MNDMNFKYLLTPFVAWLVAGSLKFLINSIIAKRAAFGLIGYGGFPSNHSAIVSSSAVMVALNYGIDSPAFGVAVSLIFIVVLDASSLRRQIGVQAAELNRLSKEMKGARLRERMGHTPLEILGGLLTGGGVAYVINYINIIM